MSRFQIRKRLRGILSGSKKPKYQTYTVTYILPDGTEKRVEAEERYNLLMASESLPSPISTGRRAGGTCPDGKCALCRVEIEDMTGLSAMEDYEQNSLDGYVKGTPHEGRERKPGEPITPRTRLACQVRIIGNGGRVLVPALVDFESLRGEENGT
ncbi:MAG: hypothetical protein VX278_16305 [Myxococcota bacterium]|nr:hypothetical protein [Myxococcota bacterium]